MKGKIDGQFLLIDQHINMTLPPNQSSNPLVVIDIGARSGIKASLDIISSSGQGHRFRTDDRNVAC